MFLQAFQKAFGVIVKRPLRLWGLSILSGVIAFLGVIFTFPFPIIGIMFSIVVGAGMSMVYLDGVEGKQVHADQLFAGFKSFFKVAGGVAWQSLWNAIWVFVALIAAGAVMAIFTIIPFVGAYIGIFLGIIVLIAGIVLAVIKSYSYSFVPYILMTMPEVNATEALRVSVKMTRGKILNMFLADIVYGICLSIVSLILGAMSAIPYIGVIFMLASLIIMVLSPLFQGLYKAAFFKMPQPQFAPPTNPAYQKFENMTNNFGGAPDMNGTNR